MRILLDTNLIIGREDYKKSPDSWTALLRILSDNHVQLMVHPVTRLEIEGDRDSERRAVVLSKLGAYSELEPGPDPSSKFRSDSLEGSGDHDVRDTHFLWAVHRNAVSYLLTQDEGLLDRAAALGLGDRSFNVSEALIHFGQFFGREIPPTPGYLRDEAIHVLSLEDSFFDSFEEDYAGFRTTWFPKVAAQGRRCCWVQRADGGPGAVLIYKEDDTDPLGTLPRKRRFKICSLKVDSSMQRLRLSELLLSYAFNFADRNRYQECFVTIKPKHLPLVRILEEFGFKDAGPINDERIYLKSLVPPTTIDGSAASGDFRSIFPSLFDGPTVGKFVVPILPRWHYWLFPDSQLHPNQTTLEDFGGGTPNHRMTPAGNAIRKAYITRSTIGLVRPGDILLFYQSEIARAVTRAGVVERIVSCPDMNAVISEIGNRTVLPQSELEGYCSKPVQAFLFWDAGRPRGETVGSEPVLSSPPRSIRRVTHGEYLALWRPRKTVS
jgi:hypothetical protein